MDFHVSKFCNKKRSTLEKRKSLVLLEHVWKKKKKVWFGKVESVEMYERMGL